MSHSVEIGIRYSSVAPAIDMEHDKIGKTKIAGFCFVEMNVKLKKSKIHLCFNIGCQHLIPDTKISILKVGGSNQPRRDGGSSMAGFTN